ncbi:MAG: hypothetical protein IJ916_04000 [Paludibacteraceae bacterium]|nr:hypothetical protein [Paludibacteraceae bacterium]
MRKFFLFGGIALLCTSLLTTSCEKDEKTTPGGGFLARSECLANFDLPDNSNDSLPVYYYDNESLPILKPVNDDLTTFAPYGYEFDLTSGTGTISCIEYMSCCPDSIYSTVIVNDNSIIINNIETSTESCNCMCRYEVVSQLWGIEAKQYTVTILENGIPRSTFNMDLSASPVGVAFE